MNEKTFELMQSRGELLARIAAQREQMTEIGTHWRTPLSLARPRSGCRAFFALPSFAGRRGRGFFRDSPSRRGRFGEGVRRVWKGYRYFTFFSAKLSSRG